MACQKTQRVSISYLVYHLSYSYIFIHLFIHSSACIWYLFFAMLFCCSILYIIIFHEKYVVTILYLYSFTGFCVSCALVYFFSFVRTIKHILTHPEESVTKETHHKTDNSTHDREHCIDGCTCGHKQMVACFPFSLMLQVFHWSIWEAKKIYLSWEQKCLSVISTFSLSPSPLSQMCKLPQAMTKWLVLSSSDTS